MKPLRSRSFLIWMFIGATCAFLLPLAAVQALKTYHGELSVAEIVRRQISDKNILYLSGLDQDVGRYKLELAKAHKPAVIAIGSSRAMQVRDFFFKVPFVNWGGGVNSLAQLEWAIQSISRLSSRPKLAIIFVDGWLFSNETSSPATYEPPDESLRNIYKNLHRLTGAIFAGSTRAETRLGLAAEFSNQGYDRYGSFHYVSLVEGRNSHDIKFSDTLRRVRERRSPFVGGDAIDPQATERWQRAAGNLAEMGISVVGILPPFAPMVIEQMNSSQRFNYLEDLASALGRNVLDFSDPRRLRDVTDCEFIDGFHAGEVVYALILLEAAQQNSHLREVLDIDALTQWASAHRGQAAPGTLSRHTKQKRETDFLELGCAK